MSRTFKYLFWFGVGVWIAAMLIFFSGCAKMNTVTSGILNYEAGNYEAAKKNIEAVNDARLKAWVDTAASIPWGAVQRCGDPNVIRAFLILHPIGGVVMVKDYANAQK
jgi:hypothetical protein